MIVSNIRDGPHRLNQFELILSDDEVSAGLDFMDPERREYSLKLIGSKTCVIRLAGYLEVAQSLAEKEALTLSLKAPGCGLV